MMTFPTPINPFSAFLNERDISTEQNVLLQLAPVTYDEMKSMLGYKPPPPATGGVGIPYFNTDGSLLEVGGVPFVRVRRDKWSGDGKYLQSRKTGAHAYLPQIAGLDWRAVAMDAKTPLGITEGEFKAIAGCKRGGFPWAGIAGVNALCKKGTQEVVDPLDQFMLDGRQVVLCFDCDAESTPQTPHKPSVEQAIHRAASILYNLGARPVVVYLARTSKWQVGKKLGLDDFFTAGGTWEELQQTAEEPVHDADLAVLNTKYAIWTAGPYVTKVDDGHTYSVTKFKELEQNRRRKTEKGTKPVAEDFLQQRVRPEFDKMVFNPSLGWGFHPEARVFNKWRGLAVESVPNAEIASGWQHFLHRICGEHKTYVEQWLAHLVQRPWERTNVAMMCVSPVQGIGKSLLGTVMAELFGRHHAISTSLERMTARFNNEMEGKVLVVVEEAEGLFKNLEGFVKDFITNPVITVEHKGINAYRVDNYARVMLNSNNPLPLRVTEFERRWFVWMPPITQDEASGEWGAWINQWSRVFVSPEGLSGIRHSLEQVSLDGFDPLARAPVTDTMLEMVSGSIKSNDLEAEAMFNVLAEKGGRMITSGEMTKHNRKAVASLTALVLSRGGGKAEMIWKQSGKTVSGHLWWTRDHKVQTHRKPNRTAVVVDPPIGTERDQLVLIGAEAMSQTYSTKY